MNIRKVGFTNSHVPHIKYLTLDKPVIAESKDTRTMWNI